MSEVEVNHVDSWRCRVFGFDTRSLSLFRIGLGILVTLDAMLRWPIIRAFYSDVGVFPRALTQRYFNERYSPSYFDGGWSLHLLYGDESWQMVLFSLQMVFGIMLTIGCATRVATLFAWVLIASHQFRSPLVMTSGDYILKLMLFWSMFLPLAHHVSVDAMVRRRFAVGTESGPAWVCHWGTAGFLLQLILMYFFTGVAKCNPVWYSGDAMSYVLNLDIYALPFSKQLLQFPWLLKVITWATLFFEVIGIWLLLIPRWNSFWRLFVMSAYWIFHVGIGLSLNIGLFPWICLVLWLPLVPSSFWQRRSADSLPRRIAVGWRRTVQATANLVCGIAIAIALVWNVGNIESLGLAKRVPQSVIWVGGLLAIDQHFQMFGWPPVFNPWFVYEGRTAEGQAVELFSPLGKLNYEEPENCQACFPDHFWRKFHRNLMMDAFGDYREPLLDFVVREWNRTHGEEDQMVYAQLICFQKKLGPDVEAQSIIRTTWATWGDKSKSAGSLFDDLDQILGSDPGAPF